MAIFNGGPRGDDFPGKNDDNKGDDVITGNADATTSWTAVRATTGSMAARTRTY